MVHKIHMGDELPSVQAGKPYQIIGNNRSVARLLDGRAPRRPASLRGAATQQDSGAAQAMPTSPEPTRVACGSCHDDVNFAHRR